MKEKNQNTVFYVITEDSDDDNVAAEKGKGKGRVVSFAKWIIQPGGSQVPDWRQRWETHFPEDMNPTPLGEDFFDPMARQHALVMGDRPHYFLEVLATHDDYRKRGLASRLLDWGSENADRNGWECYLDAGAGAQSLYQKHGYVPHPEIRDAKAPAEPMVRPVKNDG